MPITSSAKKKARRDARKRSLNLAKRVALKRAVKAARRDANPNTLKAAQTALDKAAKVYLIHGRKAARLKSRLVSSAQKSQPAKS